MINGNCTSSPFSEYGYRQNLQPTAGLPILPKLYPQESFPGTSKPIDFDPTVTMLGSLKPAPKRMALYAAMYLVPGPNPLGPLSPI